MWYCLIVSVIRLSSIELKSPVEGLCKNLIWTPFELGLFQVSLSPKDYCYQMLTEYLLGSGRTSFEKPCACKMQWPVTEYLVIAIWHFEWIYNGDVAASTYVPMSFFDLQSGEKFNVLPLIQQASMGKIH